MTSRVTNTIVASGCLGNVHSGQGCGNYAGNSTENYIGLAYNGLLGIISNSVMQFSDEEIAENWRRRQGSGIRTRRVVWSG
jgi:hypothetical protein